MPSLPQTIAQQAKFFENVLNGYAQPLGGYAKALSNLQHLWEEIYVADERPRILLCWNGEAIRGPADERNTLTRTDRRWVAVIMRGHGWENENAASVPDDPTGLAFYDVVESVRELIRVQLQASLEFPVEYIGTQTVPNLAPSRAANVFLDAYQIEFSTACDIPEVSRAPLDGLPTLGGEAYVTTTINLVQGQTSYTVTGLQLPFVPMVFLQVVVPDGGLDIGAKVIKGSESADGFAFAVDMTPDDQPYVVTALLLPTHQAI